MKNVDIKIPEHQCEKDMQLLKEIYEEPSIKKFIQEYHFDPSFVEKNIYTFKRWMNSIKKCHHCKGLHECSQDNIGLHFECTNGVLLTLGLTSCDYKRNQNELEKHIRFYKVSDLPKEWYSKSFADLEMKKETNSYRELVSLAVEYCDHSDQKGFFLYGHVGVGKSYLAALVCNDLAKHGRKVGFIHVPTMCSRMKSYLGEDEFDEQLYWMKNVDFLVMDDIGAESATPWIRDELLLPILNYRMENKLSTWFTSNEDYDSLFDHYKKCGSITEEIKAVRIMERIKALSKEIAVNGKNRRNLEF